MQRIVLSPRVRLTCNIVCILWNCTLGIVMHTWWFVTLGSCSAVVAATRFCLQRMQHKAEKEPLAEQKAERLTGLLLLALSVCLIGVNILSGIRDRGTVFGPIVMITIATYTFTKITFAIIGLARIRRSASAAARSLRSLSLADAICSVYTLQRSMLVSFPGMQPEEIRLFNLLTGTGVWLLLMAMGLHLTGGRWIRMTESKIVKINKKIAGAVTDGYKQIETGVVNGYKAIEKGVVDGYAKVEDRFVNAYLKKEGETLEDAKARLKKEE